MSKAPKQLIWIDLETDGLPRDHDGVIDFNGVHLMEFGMVVTDAALNIEPCGGYTEVVKMTKEIADALRADDFVREMHRESGLIEACIKATHTMEDIDREVDEMLTEAGYKKGEVAIAGSGIAMFDFPFIRAKMPRIASWLAYYPYDFGVFRRLLSSLAGGYVVNPQLESYGQSKVHRAMNDAVAHLREAQAYRDWVREIASAPEGGPTDD